MRLHNIAIFMHSSAFLDQFDFNKKNEIRMNFKIISVSAEANFRDERVEK